MLRWFRRVVLQQVLVGYSVINTDTKENLGTFYCGPEQAMELAQMEKIREFMTRNPNPLWPMILNLKAVPVYGDRDAS